MEYPFIGIAGNIGVGKTTFTSKLSEVYHFKPYYESVIDNPYLSDFYSDMSRWSFNLQIYFLHHRFKAHQKMTNEKTGVIQDRTIYEDVEIFAKNLYDMHSLNQRDWDNYRNLFKILIKFLKTPDLIIYLRANTDSLLTRIRGRDRSFEKDINAEYLYQLNISYDKWIDSLNSNQTMVIETDNFNIYKDKEKFKNIIINIKNRLEKYSINIDERYIY